MVLNRFMGNEGWLRAACLAISVGLHVGLGAIGWQGFGSASIDSGPIMVSLADRSAAEPAGTLATKPAAAPRGHVSAAPAATTPRRTPPPAATAIVSSPANEPPTVDTFCAIPETTVVETEMTTAAQGVLADGGEEGGGLSVGGESSGGGFAPGTATGNPGGAGGGEGEGTGGLILATPRYASNPKPEYPRLARQNRWEGVVHLLATISARGDVESVVVENSSGHQLLDASALGGVRRWRFIPARRGELQVPCEVRIPVAFKLERSF